MGDRTSHEIETLTIRIPMRLQRRGGPKADHDAGRGRAIAAEAEPRRNAGQSALLPLTCLAPDIVEAILDGRQPKGLRLAEMLGNGPLGWEEQRADWGLEQRGA